jgi:hypothetical protein
LAAFSLRIYHLSQGVAYEVPYNMIAAHPRRISDLRHVFPGSLEHPAYQKGTKVVFDNHISVDQSSALSFKHPFGQD